MTEPQNQTQESVEEIIDHISTDPSNKTNINKLSHLIKSVDPQTVQVGRYNVVIGQAGSIHVGDRIYQGENAKAIKQAIQEALKIKSQRRSNLFIIGGVLLILLVAFIFFQRPRKPVVPPYFGVFFETKDRFIEIPKIQGRPDGLTSLPAAPSSQPEILLWSQDIVPEMLLLVSFEFQEGQYKSIDRLNFAMAPGEQGAIRVIFTSPLQSGSYCFIQQDMMLPSPYILHYCFAVG